MFKKIKSKVKNYVEIIVELDGIPDKELSGEQVRRMAVTYAEEQMKGYKFQKIINHDEDGVKMLMVCPDNLFLCAT